MISAPYEHIQSQAYVGTVPIKEQQSHKNTFMWLWNSNIVGNRKDRGLCYSTDLWLIFQKLHGWKRGINKLKSNRSRQGADTYCAAPFVLRQCPTGGGTMAGPPDILWHDMHGMCKSSRDCRCLFVSVRETQR